MDDQQMADQIIAMLTELMQRAGPEWVAQFLQGALEEVGGGGMEQQGQPPMQPGMQSGAPTPPPPIRGTGRPQ